jgi:asparagine synthase (glutamine-hydrolysing)
MCGIWAYLGHCNEIFENPNRCIKQLKPRGPEETVRKDLSGAILGFTRLAINGLSQAGMQPMETRRLVWMCNGEIYNWVKLAETYGLDNHSGSDCEVLGPLYQKIVLDGGASPASFFRLLDGVFAIVIVDKETRTVTVGRDPYGVRPLFMGTRLGMVGTTVYTAAILFASEIKAMWPIVQSSQHVAPGSCQVFHMDTLALVSSEKYHTIYALKNPLYSSMESTGLEMACAALRTALVGAVRKRMLTERPVAALLSGGVDSSLIASLVATELRSLGAPPLRTFSVGMAGSMDLTYARKVANWIGSAHHEIVLTQTDFLKAIPEVIRITETFDTTTIRASVGNWLVAREVARRSDCKVVFNGDGSDEVFGSYLYFYKAPNESAYEEEVTRLLSEIHFFDVLRSDRTVSCHGLEPRTPFLDKQFVNVVRSIETAWLQPQTDGLQEKWILRRAFDDGITLPHEVLWRRKEAFSDGVSPTEKSWSQVIAEYVDDHVPEDWKEQSAQRYVNLTPTTPEQFFYRFYFEANYGKSSSHTVIPHFWMPRWSPGVTDPSARALANYLR